MSKTFTSRPAVTQGRGRGRGTNAQNQARGRTTRSTTTVTGTQQNMYGNSGGADRGTGGVGRASRGTGRGIGGVGTGAGGTRRGTGSMGRGAMGRGGGLGVGYSSNGAMDYDLEGTQERTPAQVPQEQRMSYEGGFTKISPNEKKRHEIQQMARQEEMAYNNYKQQNTPTTLNYVGTAVARQEEMAYNNYKQQNTPTTLNYVGTAGGGEIREAEVRKKSQQDYSKVKRLERQHQLTANKRSTEQAEIDRKKEEQRKKAELNERRRKEEEDNDKQKWDEQRRRTNDAFLRRLENKTKKHITNTTQSSSVQQPAQSVALPRPAVPRVSQHHSPEASNRLPENEGTIDEATNYQETEESDELEKKVKALKAIFPQYDASELREILRQLNGSLDEAVAVLQD